MQNPLRLLGKLLRPVGTVIGVTGALAAINRGLGATSGVPANHLGGTQLRWTWRGHEIFATQAGSGPPILLVHGIYAGASSYEFREIFPLLAQHHRVVAFDLLGCGLSDNPNIDYSSELFVDQIVAALDRFELRDATLVGSSLGAAFAIVAAMRVPDRIKRIVAICPAGLGGVSDRRPTPAHRTLARLVRSPIAGEALFNALASNAALRWFLRKRAYADAHSVTPAVVEHSHAVAHEPGARFVIAHYVGGALNCDLARDLPFLAAPLLVLWGAKAPASLPATLGKEFIQLAKDARLVTFAHSSLRPHEEEAPAVAAELERFIALGENAQTA